MFRRRKTNNKRQKRIIVIIKIIKMEEKEEEERGISPRIFSNGFEIIKFMPGKLVLPHGD